MKNTDKQRHEIIDARGVLCPEPIMMLHQHINKLPAGASFLLYATDPTTQKDVPAMCRYLGHELLDSRKENDTYIFKIQKHAEISSKSKS